MRIFQLLITFLIAFMMTDLTWANTNVDEQYWRNKGEYTQSIHIVNLLANAQASEVGMTATSVMVKYYNGGMWPCWTASVNYLDDYTIHAGPTQGCQNKVQSVEITPLMVADKLRTYATPEPVKIDLNKYSTHIVVGSAAGPSFNTETGLVIKPGNINLQITSDPA